ncbi:MAG: glutamine synthetase family protein, partial [Ignavibacteria bacterium]|nr:glutamine synthetase family protein [Ignavibacteria bacterium]
MHNHYALANPISMILDKPKELFTREDILRVIEQKNIERLTFHYTALDGKLKELKIPIANTKQAERVLADGERVDGSSLFKGMVDVAVSDLYVVPQYRTAFLNPFDSGSLDFICRYFTRTGDFAPFAIDNILYNANVLLEQKTGLQLYALGELEFFLLSPNHAGIFPGQKQKGYHAAAPFVKSGEIVNEMVRYITQITGTVKYAHSEVGYIESVRSHLAEINGREAEQLEIEFLPAPIREAADNLVLARWLIRNVAYKHGYVVSFAPKIEEDIAGNGLHIHMELRKNGVNCMTEPGKGLTEQARRLIGGLSTFADSLTAFGNTVSSAYLRLVPNQEAPTKICWSDMNRSAMIRVPLAWGDVNNLANKINPQQQNPYTNEGSMQTVELRSPDGSALVHLLLAGITMAAEWGLTHDESLQIAEDLYVRGNIFHEKK